MGSAAVQNIGVLSVETGNLQQGMLPGQTQLAVSYNQTSIRFKRLNSVKVDRGQTIRSATLSGGMALTRSISLWGQVPFTKVDRSGPWLAGDPALGFRWTPLVKRGSSFNLSLNSGMVLPLGQGLIRGPKQTNALRDVQGTWFSGTGVFANRTVAEGWVFSEALRLFGIQLLVDLPVTERRDGFSPGHAFQLGLHSIDRRFAWRGVVPYLSLTYRGEGRDRLNGERLDNSSGWFIYLAAAVDIRLGVRYRATFTASTPVVIGIDGTDLEQVSAGLVLRWTSPD